MPDQNFIFTNPSNIDRKDCTVFLPGWGFDGRIIELADQSRNWLIPDSKLNPLDTATALTTFLDQHQIESVVLVGWSMGAYQAIDFTILHPKRVKALYLLAIRQTWPQAEIKQIRNEQSEDPVKFMKTFYRKCFLGHKKGYRNFTESLEGSYTTNLDPARLETGLAYLQDFKLSAKTASLANLNIPTYLIHGNKDIIAPVDEIPVIPGAVSKLIKPAGHPVFLDKTFRLDWHKKKETIRLKFSRSAATYDDHATVQKEVAGQLATLLPENSPQKILETGCGTANYTNLLRKNYPTAKITAIDFAEMMLAEARKKLATDQNIYFQCIDAEIFLKTTTETFDLVTSNATMHWFDNLEYTSGLIADCLTDNGTMICSIFGPDTMQEMRTGLAAVHDKDVAVPATLFPKQEELQRIFANLFAKVEISEWQLVRRYPNLSALLKNISKTGTVGWHPGQHLINRHNLKELEQWFVKTYSHCQISYQIFMVKCRK